MAGYIMTMKDFESVQQCILNGVYSTIMTPNRSPKNGFDSPKEGTFADYFTMHPGDNIYFFVKRMIYGIGELVNVQGDCKYLNYKDADKPYLPSKKQSAALKRLLPFGTDNNRCFCIFKPAPSFFSDGVDMDEVLNSDPQAFKMLRTLWKVSFIKLGDEENRALFDIILKRNEDKLNGSCTTDFSYSNTFFNELSSYNLNPYKMRYNCIAEAAADYNGKIRHEMAIEAALCDILTHTNNPIFGHWDYISHQVAASPFKPIDYMDKIDIFGYRYIPGFSTKSKYLIVELKRDEADIDVIGQVMKYVDWIRQEYANGDYSMIEAFIVAYDFSDDVIRERNRLAVRNFIKGYRPVESVIWTNLRLIKYRYEDKSIHFEKVASL